MINVLYGIDFKQQNKLIFWYVFHGTIDFIEFRNLYFTVEQT